MTSTPATTGVVHLIDREPALTGAEMVSALVPPPQFDGATFESYRADAAYPSQQEAKELQRKLQLQSQEIQYPLLMHN